ncbi:MAG: hypothetical protein GVY33_13245 [Alphaproteobacteria bacterium]|nr:hypothetical protein [Alphaproteobacteria bacterium]
MRHLARHRELGAKLGDLGTKPCELLLVTLLSVRTHGGDQRPELASEMIEKPLEAGGLLIERRGHLFGQRRCGRRRPATVPHYIGFDGCARTARPINDVDAASAV